MCVATSVCMAGFKWLYLCSCFCLRVDVCMFLCGCISVAAFV